MALSFYGVENIFFLNCQYGLFLNMLDKNFHWKSDKENILTSPWVGRIVLKVEM